MSGLKPAEVNEHGTGVYASPSINYVAHPRYAEIRKTDDLEWKLLKCGNYVQFALECRVQETNIEKCRETLGAGSLLIIDPNINNQVIEWLVDNCGMDLVNFADPRASIVCTGIMVRFTDEHRSLLSQSQWWFRSHLCDSFKCCRLGIKLDRLKKLVKENQKCSILYDNESS